MKCDWCDEVQEFVCEMAPHRVAPGDTLCCDCAEIVGNYFTVYWDEDDARVAAEWSAVDGDGL